MKRRVVAVLMASLFPVLAACGSSNELSQPTAAGSVTVKGDFDKKPELSWTKDFAAGDVTSKVLIEGKGDKVTKATASVDANFTLASAESTPAAAYSTYATGASALPYTAKDGYAAFNEIYNGSFTIGSRVLITGWAQDMFGPEGMPNLGIGRNDSAILVVDIVKKSPAQEKPAPGGVAPTAKVDNPAKVSEVGKNEMPLLTVDPKDRNKVVGMTWAGVPDRDNNGDILIRYVLKGKGKALTPTSKVSANYYGSLYKSATPFDSSWNNGGKPIEFGLDGVVQGWRDGLTGVPVGSRVILGVPSRYGYSEAGSGSIPANAYLYFYVEVVSAK